jgi:hypothetical protein
MKVINRQFSVITNSVTYTFSTHHTYRVYDNGTEFANTQLGLQPSATVISKLRKIASTYEENRKQIQA